MKYLLLIALSINVFGNQQSVNDNYSYMVCSSKIMMAEYIMSTCLDTEVFVYEEMKCVSYIYNVWEYTKADEDAMGYDYED